LGTVVESVGGRSFGPLLLIPGLITIVPGIGDIPGVTTASAVLVVLIAGQLLFRRKHLWLPGWMLRRSAKRSKVEKAIHWLRGPAKFADRLITERLPFFTSTVAIAIGCILVAMVMPLMEVVPFGAIATGIALTAFGLALIANDGLLALFAYLATITAVGGGVYYFLS
ncbi:MAG: exopolysaccharide biosynthesis protein, partial [Planctomycetaceae bacterium]